MSNDVSSRGQQWPHQILRIVLIVFYLLDHKSTDSKSVGILFSKMVEAFPGDSKNSNRSVGNDVYCVFSLLRLFNIPYR